MTLAERMLLFAGFLLIFLIVEWGDRAGREAVFGSHIHLALHRGGGVGIDPSPSGPVLFFLIIGFPEELSLKSTASLFFEVLAVVVLVMPAAIFSAVSACLAIALDATATRYNKIEYCCKCN